MYKFNFIVTITYPEMHESEQIESVCTFVESKLRLSLAPREIDINFASSWTQPEGYCEQMNAYRQTDKITVPLQVNHVKSVIALSKLLEGSISLLRILLDDCGFSYYYEDVD